ncbi:hypothetical protein FBUS_01673 [Fasciolopsis buskii]|uniref:Uncharacterized protein n=1 Tax=Fasciolopsis buskii TaxID=27845 RepID=A0A8E0VL54_9TREM|nr:hypothetical protein FBUS_01673 [Fasciolopsis buski]
MDLFCVHVQASRLVQYLSDLRLTSRVKSEMTKLPTSNADGSSSGCSSGSSADSHLSSTATGSSTKPAVYDRFSGVWSTWCVSPKHPRHDQSNRATPSMEIEPVKLPITSDYYEAVHTGSMVDDSVSLVSDPQLIDPVYSKIRGSKFVDPVPSDYDSVIGSEDWSVPPNDDRGSLLSYSSEESDHPSAHVYHQLIKRDAMPSEVTSIQPYVNYETPKCAKNLRRPENAANPASETNSNWSIRFSKSSPLRRVIDCVVSSRSNDSVTRLCQSTPPPQLPDRSYGQSTVNLVYRLRSLLRYKETRPEQTVAVSRGLSGPQYVKKAATLTTIVHGSSSHDSIQPSAALSCLNVNKCDANNLIDNTQIPYDKGISVHSANSGLHVTNTCERYLSSDDVIQQFYPSVTEIMSLHLPQCNLDSIRFEVKQTAQIQSPKLYLQIDLLNTKSIIEHPGSVPQSTSTPLSSSPLVTGSLYPEKTEQPRAFWVDITTSPERDPTRMGAFSSPTKSLICATQNRTMMSPLMERSMEDDEVRHTLSHQ